MMDGIGCVTVHGEAEARKGVGHNSAQSTLGGLAYPMAPWEVGMLRVWFSLGIKTVKQGNLHWRANTENGVSSHCRLLSTTVTCASSFKA